MDFIICGIEHSGTTLVSELFRQVLGCDSGFECGALLAKTPREFGSLEPFFSNMRAGWQVSAEQLQQCCNTDSFEEFYKNLYQFSALFEKEVSIRFDKTPRYVINLPSITQLFNIPIIVTCKSIESIAWSDFKRSGYSNDDCLAFFNEWLPSKEIYLQEALTGYSYALTHPSCFVTHLEDICYGALQEANSIFNHCNLAFKPEYFVFRDPRYPHIRGRSLDVSVAAEHLANAPSNFIQTIRSELSHIITHWPLPRCRADELA